MRYAPAVTAAGTVHAPDVWARLLDDAWSRAESFVVDGAGITALDASAAEGAPASWTKGHVLLSTSGSTGAPRKVVLAKERLEALAKVLTRVQRNEDVSTVVAALPLNYSFALVNQWLWSRVAGKPLVVTAGFREPETLRAALLDARASMLCLVGAQVALAERAFGGTVFPSVERVHFAGGPFPQASLGAVAKMFPNALVTNNYGCTEAGPRLTSREANESTDASDVGRPLPGVELTRTLAGTIAFRSPFAAVGIGEGGVFRALGVGEWIDTGDLGEPLESGAWRVCGRTGETFKRHGEKVSLTAVLADVRAAWPHEACLLREVDARGEPGYLLVLSPAPAEADVRRILAVFREKPRATWPLAIESIASLPHGDHGKVDVTATAQSPRQRHWHQR